MSERNFPIEERIFKPEADAVYGHHTITLEKVKPSKPVKPAKPWLAPRHTEVGHRFTYTYKSLERNKALARATAALLREFPDENRMNWRLIEND